MAQYETVCVVKPDAQGDRLTKITDKVKKVLSDFKVTDLNQQEWGIRKLAYPIEKFKTGNYLYFVFEGSGNLVSELERQLNYDDAILRYMTMKVGKNGRTDVKPEPFQFVKNEAESFHHPFGGGQYERRERRGGWDRNSDRSSDRFGDRNADRNAGVRKENAAGESEGE